MLYTESLPGGGGGGSNLGNGAQYYKKLRGEGARMTAPLPPAIYTRLLRNHFILTIMFYHVNF